MNAHPRPFAACVLGVATLALGAACGSGGMPAAEFPARYAQIVCAQSQRCCAADVAQGTLQNHGQAGNEATCRERTIAALAPMVALVAASEERGRSRYQADRAERCLGGLQALPCDQWKAGIEDTPVAACREIVKPRVEIGSACAADMECKSGYCDGENLGLSGAPGKDGVCRTRAAPGAACRESDGCADGAFCESARCATRREDGAACDRDEQCRSAACDPEAARCTNGPTAGRCHAGCALAGCSPTSSAGPVLLLLTVLAVRARRDNLTRQQARFRTDP